MIIPWNVPPSRFFPIVDGMSTIWDKKGTAIECQHGARSPSSNFGVVRMNVGMVRHIPNSEFEGHNNGNLDAIHRPSAQHDGHASLLILKTPYLATDIFSQIFSIIVFFSIYSINWTYAVMGCIICIVVAISLLMRYKKI